MPNIILTEYCNLSCPYCFAKKMIDERTEDNTKISLDQLNTILEWLLPSTEGQRIGLIGGEPTLHPDLKEILHRVNSFNEFTNSDSILFTNGIELDKFINDIGINMAILVNVNNLSTDKLNKLISNLDICNDLKWFKTKKITLGCNLHLEEKYYLYFWNIVDRYPDISIIRMSVTAPSSLGLKLNKQDYYLKMKSILLNFISECKKRNLKITYDCNQIPFCLLDKKEYDLIKKLDIDKTYDKFCDPVIDITPDFKATCCFGVYNNPISCENFNTLEDLFRYFKAQMVLKTVKNNNSMCEKCEKLNLLQCQGGCLSFSSLDNNK